MLKNVTAIKRFVTVIGNILTWGALSFIAYLIVNRWYDIRLAVESMQSPYFLIFPMVLALIGHFYSCFIFRLFLEKSVSYKHLLSFMFRTQIAKYLPGNVFHYASRVTMATQLGESPQRLAVASFGDVLATICGGSVVISLGFLSGDVGSISINQWQKLGIYAFFFVLVVGAIQDKSQFFKKVVKASVLYVPMFFAVSLSLNAIIMVFDASPLNFFSLAVGHTLAWVLGFIAPGSPGGIGIREAILFQIFRGDLSDHIIVLMVLVSRLISIISDVLVFLFALFFLQDNGKNVPI